MLGAQKEPVEGLLVLGAVREDAVELAAALLTRVVLGLLRNLAREGLQLARQGPLGDALVAALLGALAQDDANRLGLGHALKPADEREEKWHGTVRIVAAAAVALAAVVALRTVAR